jgi:hypothetical protein
MQEIRLIDLAAARHRDDAQGRILRSNAPDRLDAIQLRHDDVGEDQIDAAARQQFQPLAPTGGRAHAIAGSRQDEGEGSADRRIVIDDQNVAIGRGHRKNLERNNLSVGDNVPTRLIGILV